MLTAMAIFAMLITVAFAMLNQASTVWRRSTDKIEAFQGARGAFDLVTRNLSQATLNTYLDYYPPQTGASPPPPQRYIRQSELQFVSGPAGANQLPGTINTGQAMFFQAPTSYTGNATNYGGLEAALNACGYYVQFGTNTSLPGFLGSSGQKYRYRLTQLLVPTETNRIFQSTNGPLDFTWFLNFTNAYARPIADNIIALVVIPKDPGNTNADGVINTDYTYNTRLNAINNPQPITANQLPPVVQVTMVAIDETSARRKENGNAEPTEIASALAGKFKDTTKYQADLDDLKNKLIAAGIQYRVFSSAVPIRESKWTK